MLETIIISYLQQSIRVSVSNEVPGNPKPQEYIVIQRTNGGQTDLIDKATYAIQSYSRKSKLRAAQLNERVKKAMEKFEELPAISECSLNSDYDYTNTATKEYRYQAVYNITHFA